MKNLKKFCLFVVILVGTLLLSGCGNVSGSLEDIMGKVYKDIPEDQRPMMLENTVITDENVEYYLGTKDIEFEEALASESGIGSIAHSVVLVRVKEGDKVEDVKSKIRENVNPRKWICVGVEDSDIIVESKGDLIILILVEDKDNREKLEKSFKKL